MTTPQPAALPERFTKKPVTIEAVQFKNDGSSYALIRWINEGQHAAGRRFATWRNDEIIVPTLEGEHIASVGDWIIKGVKGEFYPCKPDIFEMTYDLAALQSQPAAAVSDVIAMVRERYRGTKWGKAAECICDAVDEVILALRPQAVPMTVEQVARSLASAPLLTQIARVDRYEVMQLVRAVEAHHGITAQGAQGGEVE